MCIRDRTNYWFRTWADPDAYCGRRSGLFDKDGNEVMTLSLIHILMATMVEASLMPLRCWDAPEMPQAMYRLSLIHI